MDTNTKNIQRGLQIQLTKLENRFNQGTLTHISEEVCQNIEQKLCALFDCDDKNLVYQSELGARFMRLRIAIVEAANQRINLQKQAA